MFKATWSGIYFILFYLILSNEFLTSIYLIYVTFRSLELPFGLFDKLIIIFKKAFVKVLEKTHKMLLTSKGAIVKTKLIQRLVALKNLRIFANLNEYLK